MRSRTVALASLLLLAMPAPAVVGAGPAPSVGADPASNRGQTLQLAIIVHPDNPIQRLTLDQLRSYFRLEHRFWPDKNRVDLYLPSSKSPASSLLLERIYRMSKLNLRKYWVGKVHRGDITREPATVPSASMALSRVTKSRAALSVVLFSEVPDKGVRVLAVNGKVPGDRDYPLTGSTSSPRRP